MVVDRMRISHDAPWLVRRLSSQLRRLCLHNFPVSQLGAPLAIDSGEAKMRTASWENVNK